MRKTPKILAAAAGLVLAGGAAAAAVTVPDAAGDGLSEAESHTGTELPASHDSHPGAGASESLEAADAPEAATHGAEVSAVAQDDFATGREHGEAVSAVARGDHGAPEATGAPVATPNDGGTDTGSEASDDANADGADHAAEQAAEGSANAGEHGKP